MAVKIIVLKDVELPGWRRPFWKGSTHIDYDAKSPVKDKWHGVIYQQGPKYGEVGDKCEYIRHKQLLELEKRGVIAISGRISRNV
jgi:hypothetical protein